MKNAAEVETEGQAKENQLSIWGSFRMAKNCEKYIVFLILKMKAI